MSKFKDEVFNYLTKKENFISAFELYREFPIVLNRIKIEFWENVEQHLQNLINENTEIEQKKWECNLSENIFETYSQLTMWNNDHIYVGYEQLHGSTIIGIITNNLDQTHCKEEIFNFFKSKERFKGFKSSAIWPCYESIGLDFNRIETLERILPLNRNDLIKEVAQRLFKFGEELKNDIEKMLEMKK